MVSTYQEWTDPSWTKMVPITVTNTGASVSNYKLKLTVPYDSDMETDYDDLRFKTEGGDNWLDYFIECKNPYPSDPYAIVWIKIPTLSVGDNIIYMFYGNSAAGYVGDFWSVFDSWGNQWSADERITYHSNQEGAWDPDVAFGSDRFLVAWEEGTFPYPPYTYFYKQEIRASIFDTNGNIMVNDFEIQEGSGVRYRYEDPSIDYGDSTFFVAYEHFETPLDPSTKKIEGRLVTPSGSVGSLIDICSQSNVQSDPHVSFNSVNNHFCVVWEDARSGTSDYNIYGKLYTTSGSQVGGEKTISNAGYSQTEPWVAHDNINNHYMIVWEEGVTPDNGPFDIWVGLFDSNLNLIGPGSGPSPIKLADGTSNTDYNFPCVGFNEETERFLITWNDGDISDGEWRGNVWGTILDESGNVVVSTFQIKSGNYVRTDIVPYLSSFLVSYDNADKIFGRVVSSDGELLTSEVQLSAYSSAEGDWANMAVGNGKIFVSWEDTRISYPSPWNSNPDGFGNIWFLDIPTGSEVTYNIGVEQELVLSAYVTSVSIEPAEWTLWEQFYSIFSDDISFDILDGGGNLLLSDVSSGDNIQSLSSPAIRLMARFSRINSSYSPLLDKWNVSWISNLPPDFPSNPSPSDGETGLGLDVDLSWFCSDPDGDPLTYDVYFGTSSSPPQVTWNLSGTSYDPGTLNYDTTYYWKIVAWDIYNDSTSGPVWSFSTRVNNPPYMPSNPDPYDGETSVDIDHDLNWNGGDPDPGDTVTYNVYFGTTSPPPKVEDNQSTTTYDPGTLNYDTTYYWRIIAWDNHGASSTGTIWDFITEYIPNNPPYTPSNPNPANHSIDVDLDTNLSWTGGDPDPGDTVTYDIYFGTTSPPPLIVSDNPHIFYDQGTMQPITQYYWKIIAWDNRGAATEGPIWDFITMQVPNNPPYIPSDPDPPNHASNVDINADLNWNGGDPDPGDTVTYDIYFGITSPPPQTTWNQSDTTYDPGTLNYDTTYYWRIIAWDNHGASATGPTWDFTTISISNNPPDPPMEPIPEDDATNVPLSPTLSVYVSDPDGDILNVSFYNASDDSEIDIETNVTSGMRASIIWHDLNPNTIYGWYTIADDGEYTTQSDTWEFTTSSENMPPVTPDIPFGPSELRPFIEYNFSTSTVDPDGDQLFYKWDWDNGSYSDWLGPYDPEENVTTSYAWDEMGVYEIRVKAKDSHDAESDWSDPLVISVSAAIEIENLKIGYIYFTDVGFAYLRIFEMLGIALVLNDELGIEVTTSSDVVNVKFVVTNLLTGVYNVNWDNDTADGFFCSFAIFPGLYNITVYAYDENENELGSDQLEMIIFLQVGGERMRLLRR